MEMEAGPLGQPVANRLSLVVPYLATIRLVNQAADAELVQRFPNFSLVERL